jgi:glycine/D-amino acid oxidase-like deaminating enzyme
MIARSQDDARAPAAAGPLTQPDERRTAAAVLIIGTGAAGLRATIELAERGVQVLCVGKRRRDDAHTVLASGGINAALATTDPEDSWAQHAADTVRESYWLAGGRQLRAERGSSAPARERGRVRPLRSSRRIDFHRTGRWSDGRVHRYCPRPAVTEAVLGAHHACRWEADSGQRGVIRRA